MAYANIDSVKNLLPKHIRDELDQPQSNVTTAVITDLMTQADEMINSELSGIYITPLRQVNVYDPVADSETTRYPYPIPYIAERFTCDLVYNELYAAQQDPDVSEYGKVYRKTAQASLNKVISGLITLHGQDMIGKRFVRPELFDAMRSTIEPQPPTQETI